MEKRNISDLPPEILIKIFEQLESPEIFKVSEVCKNWLNIAQHPTIVKKTIVKLHSLENNRFLKSWRKFNFKLNIDMHLPYKYFEFKDKFLENIIEIEFDEIYLPSLDILRQYLENLTNLKSLSFIDCRFQNLTTFPDVLISLNVTSLLFRGTLLKDAVVDYILSITPNLKVLTCFHHQQAIVRYVNNPELTKCLRELKLYDCRRNDFSEMFQSKHLNLQKFVWDSFDSSHRQPFESFKFLEMFLSSQTNLKVLIVNESPSEKQVFLKNVIKICSLNLNALEHLSFNCSLINIVDRSLDFEPIWKLKFLTIAEANSIIFTNLTKSSKMESLILQSFCEDINETSITDKFKFLKNLKDFRLSLGHMSLSNFLCIKNETIQAIFEHLVNLRELCLQDTSIVFGDAKGEITDFGITGCPLGFPISRLTKLERFVLQTNTDGITDASIRHIESMKSLKTNQVIIRESKNAKCSNNPIFFK